MAVRGLRWSSGSGGFLAGLNEDVRAADHEVQVRQRERMHCGQRTAALRLQPFRRRAVADDGVAPGRQRDALDWPAAELIGHAHEVVRLDRRRRHSPLWGG